MMTMLRRPCFDLNNHDDQHDLNHDVDDQDAFLVWEEEAAGGIPVVRLPARIVILVTLIVILIMIFIQLGLQILKTKPLQADNIWKPDVILYNNADRFYTIMSPVLGGGLTFAFAISFSSADMCFRQYNAGVTSTNAIVTSVGNHSHHHIPRIVLTNSIVFCQILLPVTIFSHKKGNVTWLIPVFVSKCKVYLSPLGRKCYLVEFGNLQVILLHQCGILPL